MLAVVLAAKTYEGKARDMAATHFDVGLAASQLVTQAESMGLKSHYMGGIVPEAIAATLNVTDHEVVCVIAIGMQGSTEGQDQVIVDRENLERTRNNPGDVYLVDKTL